MILTKRLFLSLAAAGALTVGTTGSLSAASTGAAIGQPAPQFTAVDSNGKTVKLSDFRGKVVVLEWTNHQCPYTVKHYSTGNMQKVQAKAREMGVVWLSIISSAPGRDGHVTPTKANELTASRSAKPSHVLLDPKGVIGRAYDARTTPHMYIIGTEGQLLYRGGIDDNSSWRPASVKTAKNYVTAALDDIKAGRKIAEPVTRHYGCTIKYGS